LAEATHAVLQGEEADLVASHGQTVAHVAGVPRRATLQLGSPAVIAERTGLTVVSDFRSADIAAGGEGAPLVSFVDLLCLRDATKPRVLLNIGGMANVTYVPPVEGTETPRAFDTGPGNALIDRAIYRLSGESSRYDPNGELAARGRLHPPTLDWLMRHPYLHRLPPKSTGREEFGDQLAEVVIEMVRKGGGAPADVVATLTTFTAQSIAEGLAFLPEFDEVVVAGGGIHNDTLMKLLRQELAPHPVSASDSMGIPADAKEALVFAILANQTIRGLSSNVPGCTGARHEAPLGSITPGRNFVQLMKSLLR
jgi:anhydro-N-acetylmuramic acid kinase